MRLDIHALEHADAMLPARPVPYRLRRHLQRRRWPLPERRPVWLLLSWASLTWLLVQVAL